MKRVLILYFSGVGNTRGIAYVFLEYMRRLLPEVNVRVMSIFDFRSMENTAQMIFQHDLLIVAAPVYAIGPAYPMKKFIEALPNSSEEKLSCFIILTKTGIAANARKQLTELLETKGIITCGCVEFYAPGTDRSLKQLSKKLSDEEQKRLIQDLEFYMTIHSWPFRWATSLLQAFSTKNADAPRKLVIKTIGKIKTILYSEGIRRAIILPRWNTWIMNWLQKNYFNSKEAEMHELSRPVGCDHCQGQKCVTLSCPGGYWIKHGEHMNKIHCPDACMKCVHTCPSRKLKHAGMCIDYIDYRLREKLVNKMIEFFFLSDR